MAIFFANEEQGGGREARGLELVLGGSAEEAGAVRAFAELKAGGGREAGEFGEGPSVVGEVVLTVFGNCSLLVCQLAFGSSEGAILDRRSISFFGGSPIHGRAEQGLELSRPLSNFAGFYFLAGIA